jgi:predicted transcriptional regulator
MATRNVATATNDLVDVLVPARLTYEGEKHPEDGGLPRKQSETLTEAELRLMNVLWQKKSATVHEVLQALSDKPALAYNSVLTTIRILEKKGYVKHVKDGRAHVYIPRVDRKDATRFEIRHLVNRFFKDSHELLVLNILEDQDIDAEELDRLRKLVEGSK